jgi:hypothetical protein
MVLDQNNDEGEIPPPEEMPEEDMMAMMGFAGFGTTKVSRVPRCQWMKLTRRRAKLWKEIKRAESRLIDSRLGDSI